MSYPLTKTYHTCGIIAPARPPLWKRRALKKRLLIAKPIGYLTLHNSRGSTFSTRGVRTQKPGGKMPCPGCVYDKKAERLRRWWEWLDVDGLLADQEKYDDNLVDRDAEKLAIQAKYEGDQHKFTFEPHAQNPLCWCYWCRLYYSGFVGQEEHDYTEWCSCIKCSMFRYLRAERIQEENRELERAIEKSLRDVEDELLQLQHTMEETSKKGKEAAHPTSLFTDVKNMLRQLYTGDDEDSS